MRFNPVLSLSIALALADNASPVHGIALNQLVEGMSGIITIGSGWVRFAGIWYST